MWSSEVLQTASTNNNSAAGRAVIWSKARGRPWAAKKSQKPLTGLEPVTLGLKVPRNSQLCYRGDNVWLFTIYIYVGLTDWSLKEALHALCRHLQTRAGYRKCRQPCCICGFCSICSSIDVSFLLEVIRFCPMGLPRHDRSSVLVTSLVMLNAALRNDRRSPVMQSHEIIYTLLESQAVMKSVYIIQSFVTPSRSATPSIPVPTRLSHLWTSFRSIPTSSRNRSSMLHYQLLPSIHPINFRTSLQHFQLCCLGLVEFR
jgi:hypothetical protein